MLSAYRTGSCWALLVFVLGGGISACKDEPAAQHSALSAQTWARIPAGELVYYPAGEFLENGYPITPSLVSLRFEQDLYIMKRQVSQAEYAACVSDKACTPLDRTLRDAVAQDIPVVGVSWQDAQDYARWLSAQTGQHYRLPTFAEWVHAAGPDYSEALVTQDYDPANPAQRWLAEYQLEAQRQKNREDTTPLPFGSFGSTPLGLQDMVGNVWDWTDTCHSRTYLELGTAATEFCGVRVVAGPHRSVIAEFIRDPKGGACSVGIPPSNLGIRLVRDERNYSTHSRYAAMLQEG